MTIMELLVSPEAWISLATLAVLEIVLGIDNLIFISILTNKLPPEQRAKARNIGIVMDGTAQALRENEWLMTIKQRAALPG